MMDFGWEEYNRYNSWKHNVQSSLFPPTHPTRYEPLAKETRFLSTAKVSFTHFASHELSTERPATHFKLQQRPLDLQLSADEFINRVEGLPKNGNGWNCLEDPLSRANSSNAEELNLSLSIGGNGKRVEGTTRNFFMKKTYFSSRNVIDLKEPVNRMSGYANSGPSLDSGFLEIHPKVNESQDFAILEPFLPTSVKKIQSLDIAESNSFQEYSECCQEQTTSSSEGVRNYHDEAPSDDLSPKMQQNLPFQGLLDLNKVHQDDSSCCSDDHIHSYPSIKSPEVSEPLNETSVLLEQDNTVNLALLDLNSNMNEDIRTQNSENNSTCASHENDTVGLKPKPTREVSSEKSEESCIDQSQNSLQERQGNRFHASYRSCISDNDSSNGKTLHSGITSDVSDHQVSDVVTVEHDKINSDSSDLQNECYHNKGESAEVESSIQRAAESLIHMSLTHSAKLGSKEMENEKRERPQCSFDSFELNTLNLTESSLDDDSVSSKPFELNSEGKDFGPKLRRGRRMKDFQKEILPSLASLSRHEILEDINIMEGALRSREYRKNRGKMVTCGENWAAPLRSRRSRVNYGGRRNYS